MLRLGNSGHALKERMILKLISVFITPSFLLRIVQKGFMHRAFGVLVAHGKEDEDAADDSDACINDYASSVLEHCCKHVPESLPQFSDQKGISVMLDCLQRSTDAYSREQLAKTITEYMARGCECGGQTAVQVIAQTDSLQLAMDMLQLFPKSEDVYHKRFTGDRSSCTARTSAKLIRLGLRLKHERCITQYTRIQA
jgi:hypothetical protein